MKFLTLFLLSFTITILSMAQNGQYSDPELADFKWQNRVIVIFDIDEDSESYRIQKSRLESEKEGLTERDLTVISVFERGISNIDGNSISSSSAHEIRRELNSKPDIFRFVLIGKDGGVKMDSYGVVTVNDLFTRIDRMPMRREELRWN
jgi:hypothetical protein